MDERFLGQVNQHIFSIEMEFPMYPGEKREQKTPLS
jgi:hypothetical protein